MVFGVYPGGVLRFTTKTGDELKDRPSIFLKLHSPLGYQKPAEFYVPKYDFAKSDYSPIRSTLYWLPINDCEDITLNIPKISSVIVSVEGVSRSGDCIHLDKKLLNVY